MMEYLVKFDDLLVSVRLSAGRAELFRDRFQASKTCSVTTKKSTVESLEFVILFKANFAFKMFILFRFLLF